MNTDVASGISSHQIKPIETKYKGYRFRSRLEARWAVFFDALGISWEYEKEGYDLGDAGYYLPDFYLPQFDAWAEVKPSYESKTREEAIREGIDLGIKCISLLEQTQNSFLYLQGMPENKPYLLTTLCDDGSPHHEMVCFHIHSTGALYFLSYGNSKRTEWEEVGRAVTAARSARFEHGEKP